MIEKQHIKDPNFKTEAEAFEEKRAQEALLEKKAGEYRERNEALMRELGVIEIPILDSDVIKGIRPSSSVFLHTWKEGETYIKKPVESKPEETKKNGKKSSK